MAGTNGVKRGGANGGGGSAKGVAVAREGKKIKKTNAITPEEQKVLNAGAWKEGTYVDEDGEEWEISFTKNPDGSISMLSDGNGSATGRIIVRDDGYIGAAVLGGEFYNFGEHIWTTDAKKAMDFAFGKPSDGGYKLKNKKKK